MKLGALAAASGVSTASIKFYIHEGLLSPGRKKNATTAAYDDAHLHRLELIRWLRDELNTPISEIAELTRAIGDPSVPTIELMGICQEFALRGNSGLPASALRAPGSPPFTLRSDSSPVAAPRSDSDRFDGIVTEALDRLGWPAEESAARTAVARTLEMVDAAGYSVSADSVVDQCRAIAATARDSIRPIGTELSRDEVCLRVIRGITMHNRQLIAISALAHASLSIIARALAVDGGSAADGPDESPA